MQRGEVLTLDGDWSERHEEHDKFLGEKNHDEERCSLPSRSSRSRARRRAGKGKLALSREPERGRGREGRTLAEVVVP